MAVEIISLEAARKPFRRDGLGYVWTLKQQGIELRADYIRPRYDEIYSQVTVTLNGKHLHLATFNISKTKDRHELVAELSKLTNGLSLPWPTIIENFCVGVLQAEREGNDTEWTKEAPKKKLNYLIDRLVMKGKTNMVFAPGGHGKGMLCVGICVALASKRGIGELTIDSEPILPFYFDWEDDFDTFEERCNAVARGFGIAVPRMPYRRMRGLAADRINEMARALSDAGSTYAVIDSFSAAGGSPSAGTSWDTIAHRLFDALDLVPNMTWLIVDHVTGDTMQNKVTAGKAYGSIQKMNRVRNAWEIQSDQEPDSDTLHMRFYDAKWNHRGKQRPWGMRLEFVNDRVIFTSEDPIAAMRAPVSIADKMAFELTKGPLSTSVLALALGTTDATIRNELRRHPEMFEREGPFIRLSQDWDTEGGA